MIIDTLGTEFSAPKREPKEMLSVTKLADGRDDVRINFSSLDIIQTCKRKAYFALERGLFSQTEGPATLFGSATHAALEVWYCAPRTSRKRASGQCDDYQALLIAGATDLSAADHGSCVRCAAASRFAERGAALAGLPQGDQRSIANGIDTLNNYFDHYADDPFTVLSDGDGPMCERRVEFLLCEDPIKRITFFGTIDAILVNEHTGATLVCDHKTTTRLGADFYNRVRPNFQYTGYTLGAQRCLGLKTDMFMSNGIQVAKTVKGLARQVTQITPDDFAELQLATERAVNDYLDCAFSGLWPQSTPNACTHWGGCSYRQICEVPRPLQENIISSLYAQKEMTV